MSLLLTLTSDQSLYAAWARVQRNAGAPGGDGVSIADFAEDLAGNLARLQAALRSGTYLPGALRAVDIPKPRGGVRTLRIPCVVDRIAQTAVGDWLMRHLDGEMEDASFGYRPGRSVQMAVARVASLRQAGYRWVVDGDIERFFDNVPHDRLLERLRGFALDREVIALIGLWLEHLGEEGRGLPQGSPISPVLSNLYLDSVDEAIQTGGVRLVRFADDFVLLTRHQRAAEKAMARMAHLLEEHGLRLHPEKTRILPFEASFKFLGHLFVQSLVFDDDDEEEALREAKATPEDDAGESTATGARVPSGTLLEEAVEGDSLLPAAPMPPGREPANPVHGLYVVSRGIRLARRNDAFALTRDGMLLAQVPGPAVDRIEIHPGAEISGAALRLAVERGTALALVDGHGAPLASLEQWPSHRAALHLDQARVTLDEGRRLGLARRIVYARVFNQRALLRRLNRRRKDGEVGRACTGIGRVLRRLAHDRDIDQLLGHEGEAAALYFPALGRTLPEGWEFRLRRRRPPPDPVNLLISFTGWMLYRDVGALVRRQGLHPGIGVLHTPRDRHPACVSDLVEEFRAPLSEGLSVYMVNNRVVETEDFVEVDDGRLRLAEGAGRRIAEAYEGWLARPVRSPSLDRTVSWKGLIEEQVRLYMREVRDGESYEPYRMDY